MIKNLIFDFGKVLVDYDFAAFFRIFQLLDGYIISSEEHVIKPEPAIYQRLFDKFNLRPEECLFADDKEENIIGSRAMGMEGIVFQNATQYAKEMRAIISAKK